MSVSGSSPVGRREWGGEDDPRLPTGMWIGQFSILGDGGGGSMTVELILMEAAAPALDSNLYSLELVNIAFAGAVTQDVVLQTFGLGESDGVQAWNIAMNNTTALTVSFPLPRDLRAVTPTFLGSGLAQGTATGIRAVTANINSAILNFQAEGYIWDARARSILGGPRVPLGALYR